MSDLLLNWRASKFRFYLFQNSFTLNFYLFQLSILYFFNRIFVNFIYSNFHFLISQKSK
jgi:hypothetical protein